ncbi:MAG: signal peptidase II [Lachnospiraceae bacterium]|nr:signal peptidase II [Lachnospiraceae bacterium]
MIYVLVAAVIFGLDYCVKQYIEDHKDEGEAEDICGGRIVLRRLSNRGSAGGFFADKSDAVRVAVSTIMGCMGIHFFLLLFQKGQKWTKFAYALILGGGLSNMVDRYQKGYVTDYFSFKVKWKKLKRLVFNLSDMFILLGCAILVVAGLKKK